MAKPVFYKKTGFSHRRGNLQIFQLLSPKIPWKNQLSWLGGCQSTQPHKQWWWRDYYPPGL